MTCVEYLVDDNGFGKSYRDLWIGNKYFRLMYQSNEWRSNVGDVSIAVMDSCNPWGNDRPFLFEKIYPLLAMDYVMYHGKPYYIDLNTSPGIPKEIGITATDVVDNIKDFVFGSSVVK